MINLKVDFFSFLPWWHIWCQVLSWVQNWVQRMQARHGTQLSRNLAACAPKCGPKNAPFVGDNYCDMSWPTLLCWLTATAQRSYTTVHGSSPFHGFKPIALSDLKTEYICLGHKISGQVIRRCQGWQCGSEWNIACTRLRIWSLELQLKKKINPEGVVLTTYNLSIQEAEVANTRYPMGSSQNEQTKQKCQQTKRNKANKRLHLLLF